MSGAGLGAEGAEAEACERGWNSTAYTLLGQLEDLGEHPQSPRGPHWATYQSLTKWAYGDYPDRHHAISSSGSASLSPCFVTALILRSLAFGAGATDSGSVDGC